MSCDVHAIQHILQHNFIYTKPSFLQFLLGRILGDGIYLSFCPSSPLTSSFTRPIDCRRSASPPLTFHTRTQYPSSSGVPHRNQVQPPHSSQALPTGH